MIITGARAKDSGALCSIPSTALLHSVTTRGALTASGGDAPILPQLARPGSERGQCKSLESRDAQTWSCASEAPWAIMCCTSTALRYARSRRCDRPLSSELSLHKGTRKQGGCSARGAHGRPHAVVQSKRAGLSGRRSVQAGSRARRCLLVQQARRQACCKNRTQSM